MAKKAKKMILVQGFGSQMSRNGKDNLSPLVMNGYSGSLGLYLEREEVTKNDVSKLTY